MNVTLTQWNKFGDHPLVKTTEVREFPYEELIQEGCGFINNFIAVRPTDYIVEINGIFISVISEDTALKILNQ